MKISELVEELERIKIMYGDLPVYIRQYGIHSIDPVEKDEITKGLLATEYLPRGINLPDARFDLPYRIELN